MEETDRAYDNGVGVLLDTLKEILCGENVDNIQVDIDNGIEFVNIEDRKIGVVRKDPLAYGSRRCIISWTEKNMP